MIPAGKLKIGLVAETSGEDVPSASMSQTVYEGLRRQLITGRLAPGVALSTRGLAQQLGVSQMPVREALSRLATEGAVEIRSKRAILVARMTRNRFDEIMRCRLLLEPAAAVDALPFINAARLREIRAADDAMDEAMQNGDVNAYMEANFRFHSLIYRAHRADLLNRMIETLWMQFGPFMRVVYGRYGTAGLVDQHVVATQAIVDRDAEALRHAIASDIGDGMNLIRDSVLDTLSD